MKLSNRKLLGILFVLLAIYAGIRFWGGTSRSKTLKETLVNIQRDRVSRVLIDKGGEQLELINQDNSWKVKLDNGKYAQAMESSAKELLSNLASIQPSRLVAKRATQWKDYQVDSTGTRVQVFEGEKRTLDIVLGRLAMKAQPQNIQPGMYGRQQQAFYSFVRLQGDENVYAADNFMSLSVSTKADAYRNKKLLTFNRDSIHRVSFLLPDEKSFVLEKTADKQWEIEGQQADSVHVEHYLSELAYVNGQAFADGVNPEGFTKAAYSLLINEEGKPEPVQVHIFEHPQYKFILNSSENKEAYFADPDSLLFKQIVKYPLDFIKQETN
ncbi:DUF4340 domain-containing protein [Rapidithrix thailandica]|uniref:DUF4340 domain-containing protein n=1 Tax=Rapidithrix thailandica TaxID=413964 RepID=A0AAW9SAC5_9BACT